MDRIEMFRALAEDRLDDLTQMLRTGADINIVADFDTSLISHRHIVEGDTLVHAALHMENQDALELLLRFGANLNISSVDGVTPLQIAVNKGNDDVALWLLDNDANFNTTDCVGLTPLHYTTNAEIIQYILDKGVSVDLVAHSTGYTPLHYAAYHNQASKVSMLIYHGADPRARGHKGETPLHLLAAQNLMGRDITECGEILLNSGAEIDAHDEKNNTPLHWAAGVNSDKNWMDNGNPSAIAFLLDNSANFKAKNRDGLTPLYLAHRFRNPKYRKPFEVRNIKPALIERVKLLW